MIYIDYDKEKSLSRLKQYNVFDCYDEQYKPLYLRRFIKNDIIRKYKLEFLLKKKTIF
jgi:hypothetical protein